MKLRHTIACGVILALAITTVASANTTTIFSKKYEENSVATKNQFAEELSILLDKKQPTNNGCFIDVTKTNQFAPAICGLKEAKVFVGISRSFFHGEDKLKWGDVIRGVCRAKSWIPQKNYYGCKAFAESQNLFAAPLPKLIRDTRTVNFGDLEVFLNRTINQKTVATVKPATTVLKSIQIDNNIPIIPPKGFKPSPSFQPVVEGEISSDFFEGIQLSSPLPNLFYQNEIYTIEGSVSDSNTSEVLIFICNNTNNCTNADDYLGNVKNKRFSIPVHFTSPGNIQIGIIQGRRGTSRITTISVLPKTPSVTGGTKPTEIGTNYVKGVSTFTWKGGATVTQFVIFQDKTRLDFLFRQPINSFNPNTLFIKDLKEGDAYWFVMNDSVESELQKIKLTKHHYRDIDTDSVEVKKLDEYFSTITRFTFNGVAKIPLSSRAAVTLPSGLVTDINFQENNIKAGENFEVPFDLRESGTYIFEVNDTEGKAVINVPIYVNAGLPLIPDYFDLNESVLTQGSIITNITAVRTTLHTLINNARRSHGLEALNIDPKLNDTAQAHSDDMSRRNFFAHVNPDGLSPDDRRKAAEISTPIRENLARSTSLEFAHEGLMRSPIHRDAILDPKMKRVGMGIAQDASGYIYVTEHFSADSINSGDLSSIKNQMIQAASTYRAQNGLQSITSTTLLDRIATQWADRMTAESFFGLTAPDGAQLLDIIRGEGVSTAIQVHALKSGSLEKLIEQITTQDALKNNANTNIGIGLAVNKIGEIFLIVIYTP